jgi:hypothetical protein
METSVLDFQLNMLKTELDVINAAVRQMDEISKSIKEWTIGLWTAAVGGALITPKLSHFIGVTAAIPLLFWLVDTWHRRIQRKFIWRSDEISRFLNGPNLLKSFEEKRLVGFTLFDPASRTERSTAYWKFISWRKVMWLKSLTILYLGLAVLSAIIGIVAHRM